MYRFRYKLMYPHTSFTIKQRTSGLVLSSHQRVTGCTLFLTGNGWSWESMESVQ
jgi:hypothetical protein